jgi:phosphoribosyl 1,2-cyclic phosphodiesterase
MKLTFWGVRGSISTSGPEFARFGGHTTCLEVEAGGHRLILDAGTGVRPLGERLAHEARVLGRPVKTVFAFTHLHWDHIQGFPFFGPAFIPSTELELFGPREGPDERSLQYVLTAQMAEPTFPVTMDAMPSDQVFHDIGDGGGFERGPFRVRTRALEHPNGVLGYRIEAGGRTLCFATDTEHPRDGSVDEALLDLARGADLLVYDAQYTPAEYAGEAGPPRRGWGHSTYVAAAQAARAAGVKRLALFHHDPGHDDRMVAHIESEAQRLFGESFAARERTPIEV